MTQSDEILRDLELGWRITPRFALTRYGCMRLGARIYELRKRGYDIRRTLITGINRHGKTTRYAEYFLHKGEEEANENHG